MDIKFTENTVTVKPLVARPWALLLCEITGLQISLIDAQAQTTVFMTKLPLTDRIRELITNFCHQFTSREFLTRIPYHSQSKAVAIEKDESILFNVQVLDIADKWQTIWRFLVDRTDAIPHTHAGECQDAARYAHISENSPPVA